MKKEKRIMEKLKKCKYCQMEIPKKAKVCPNCNRALKGHGCLVSILIFLAIGVICSIIMTKGIEDMEKHPEKYDDSIAAKYIEVTGEQGESIDCILKECGIENVKTFEHDELLDNAHVEGEIGYRIGTKEVNNIILYLTRDKSVYSVRYADYDLYADGKTIATVNDYRISSSEASQLKINCENKVKETLKSPSTAKFPNITEWGFKKEKNITTVQGYVDAQNSFGAELRSNFQFVIDTDTNTIQSYIFDGQEMIQ